MGRQFVRLRTRVLIVFPGSGRALLPARLDAARRSSSPLLASACKACRRKTAGRRLRSKRGDTPAIVWFAPRDSALCHAGGQALDSFTYSASEGLLGFVSATSRGRASLMCSSDQSAVSTNRKARSAGSGPARLANAAGFAPDRGRRSYLVVHGTMHAKRMGPP